MINKADSIFSMLSGPLLEEIAKHDLSEDQIEAVIEDLLDEGHDGLVASLELAAPKMLEEESNLNDGFCERNYKRWKEAFDLSKMLFRICSEIGEEHSQEGPQEADPLVFDTLARLHPRGLLVFSEIDCLLRGGFADGALTRWRTLHELAVVACFIEKHKREAALPYRLSFVFERNRAAKQFNEYAEQANLQPFSAEEMSEFKVAQEDAREALGSTLRTDWDWARKGLGKAEKERVTFFDLEKDVGLDHWRPRVRWASKHTHGGFTEYMGLLGMSEASELAFQIGPSNSGLVDPFHMSAISLMNLTSVFLFYPEPNFDRILMQKVISAVVDKIGEAALIGDQRTADDLS